MSDSLFCYVCMINNLTRNDNIIDKAEWTKEI